MPRLEGWTLMDGHGVPAERLADHSQCLRGRVYEHPRHPDGKPVRTSEIRSLSRRAVTTTSGQVYELGAPDPAYLKWLGQRSLPLAPALQLVPAPSDSRPALTLSPVSGGTR